MRTAYRVLAGLIALGVFVQAAAIAGGWFGTIQEIDPGQSLSKDWEGNVGRVVHGMIGMMVMPALALVLLVVAFFARIPGGVKWAGFILVAVLVQVALAWVAFDVPVIGALHGMNALVVLGLAFTAARRATVSAPAPIGDRDAAVGARTV